MLDFSVYPAAAAGAVSVSAAPTPFVVPQHADEQQLACALIEVGRDLYKRGYEQDALAAIDAAFSALQSQQQQHQHQHQIASLAKRLHAAQELLRSDPSQLQFDSAASSEESFEDHSHLPDLYLEDECDVGPRMMREPLRPAQLIQQSASDRSYLEAVLCFNRALIVHDNLDFSEAKRLYHATLHALQGLMIDASAPASKLGGIMSPATPACARPLLEMGTRAHNNMGHICYLAGEEEVARAHFEASLVCAKQLADYSKADRLTCATVLSNWCRVCWMRGDISDNLYSGLREVLRIRSAVLRFNHVDVAAAHFNIAVAEYARRRNQHAVSHLMHYLHVASERAEAQLEGLETVPALIYLLLIQNEDREDGVSQELVRGLRTLQDKRQDQGPDCPEVASVLNFIGTLLFHKEDFENALLFFREELRLEENLTESSSDDISVSVTCNNIGRILQELGKLNEAVHYYQRALKPKYGDISQLPRSAKGSLAAVSVTKAAADSADCNSNPSSANLFSTVWYNLGLIHDKLGSHADAICAFEMSLELRKAMLGNDHPDIACLLYNIGVLQMEQQLLTDASKSFREALRIRRDSAAAGQLNDKHIVKTLEKLSALHKAKGNIRGALEASHEVLRIQEVSADYDAAARMRETGVTLRCMAELHHAIGEDVSALNMAMQSVHKLSALSTVDSTISVDPLESIPIVEQLVSSLLLVGSLYHEQCEPLKAASVLQRAALAVHGARTRAYTVGVNNSSILSSLNALQEVANMLATTHCAAQA